MFRREFVEVISKTGMVPLKDLRPLMQNTAPTEISEFGLLNLPFFDDSKFARQIAETYKLTFIDLFNARVSDEVLGIIKKVDAIKYRAIPIQKKEGRVVLAIYDPTVLSFKPELQTLLQLNIEYILTNIASWKKIFSRIVASVEELVGSIKEIAPEDEKEESVTEKDIGEEVVRYVNRMLAEAFVKKASDIHIEPYEKSYRIRYRIDGSLVEMPTPPANLMLPIISRVKIMSQMDISERRKPQDGRIKLLLGNSPIDYRVSSLPTLFGEKIVLRLLDTSSLQLDMTKLGFETKQIEIFKEAIYKPYGICLVTGPTGSGKTTTLYSAMSELNQSDVNISTAEDPVEYNLYGINQVNIRKEVGLTFASALKSFLRQDPDIIMVGEVRDLEVGEIAVEAALTGHLVLSTLHTNDAPATVTRLLNMGIEPFLVTASLNVVVAQRLCRKICPYCKEIDQSVTVEQLVACGVSPNSANKMKVYKGKGCSMCENTGYKGRVAIYEVMEINGGIRELILKNASTDDLKREAVRNGMKTLRMSALTKVAQGMTSLEEAITNSASDKF